MRIENCMIIDNHAYGNVYGNPKFPDGTSIVTSKIEGVVQKDGYVEIHTKNSVYKGFVIEN